MKRSYIDIEYDFVTYECEVIWEEGFAGDYNNAPEPHTVEVIKIYNTKTDKFINYADDIKLYDTIDQDVYDMIDRGDI